MIIYKTQDDKTMVFIHNPKNNKKYIRQQLLLKKDLWGLQPAVRLNMAFMVHFSYINHKQYISTDDTWEYYAHSRNPL